MFANLPRLLSSGSSRLARSQAQPFEWPDNKQTSRAISRSQIVSSAQSIQLVGALVMTLITHPKESHSHTHTHTLTRTSDIQHPASSIRHPPKALPKKARKKARCLYERNFSKNSRLMANKRSKIELRPNELISLYLASSSSFPRIAPAMPSVRVGKFTRSIYSLRLWANANAFASTGELIASKAIASPEQAQSKCDFAQFSILVSAHNY